MPSTDADRPIRLLHLSDIHFRADTAWDADPVGIFPRARQAHLGLDDLAGNCWEWCDDFYAEDKRDGGSSRVLRGGAFDGGARYLRSSDRGRFGSWDRYLIIGFRCVLAARRQP